MSKLFLWLNWLYLVLFTDCRFPNKEISELEKPRRITQNGNGNIHLEMYRENTNTLAFRGLFMLWLLVLQPLAILIGFIYYDLTTFIFKIYAFTGVISIACYLFDTYCGYPPKPFSIYNFILLPLMAMTFVGGAFLILFFISANLAIFLLLLFLYGMMVYIPGSQ